MLANRVESWFEEWKQQGLEEGRAEGREKGREEGRQEGRQEGLQKGLQKGELSGRAALLEKLLRLKFNNVDDAVIQRLHSANEAELDLWAERVLFANTLEEVMQ